MKRYAVFTALLIFMSLPAHAQQIDVTCPQGSNVLPGGETYDPITGGLRMFLCVDSRGGVTLQTASHDNVLNVKQFGARGDTKIVTDGTTTNATRILSSATAAFTISDLGKRIVAIESATGLVRCGPGPITGITSSTTITYGGPACNGGNLSSVTLLWGTDDTAALQAAQAFALAVVIGPMPTIYLPAGGYLVSSRPFNFQSKAGFPAPSIRGDGKTLYSANRTPGWWGTTLYMDSQFSFTGINANEGAVINYPNVMGSYVEGMEVNGVKVHNAASANIYGVRSQGGVSFRNFVVTGYMSNVAAIACLGGSSQAWYDVYSLDNGVNAVDNTPGVEISGADLNVYGGLFSNNQGVNLLVKNIAGTTNQGNRASFFGTEVDEATTGPETTIQNSTDVFFYGCHLFGGPNHSAVQVDGTSVAYFYGNAVGPFGADTPVTGLKVLAGGTAIISGNRLYSSGGGNGLDNSGTVLMGSGNTVSSQTGNGLFAMQLAVPGTLFANLGTPANGTFLYCSNCTIANPCATGGTGALAKRLNGVWVCN